MAGADRGPAGRRRAVQVDESQVLSWNSSAKIPAFGSRAPRARLAIFQATSRRRSIRWSVWEAHRPVVVLAAPTGSMTGRRQRSPAMASRCRRCSGGRRRPGPLPQLRHRPIAFRPDWPRWRPRSGRCRMPHRGTQVEAGWWPASPTWHLEGRKGPVTPNAVATTAASRHSPLRLRCGAGSPLPAQLPRQPDYRAGHRIRRSWAPAAARRRRAPEDANGLSPVSRGAMSMASEPARGPPAP